MKSISFSLFCLIFRGSEGKLKSARFRMASVYNYAVKPSNIVTQLKQQLNTPLTLEFVQVLNFFVSFNFHDINYLCIFYFFIFLFRCRETYIIKPLSLSYNWARINLNMFLIFRNKII